MSACAKTLDDAHVVRMCTSQLSDASSAVWTRLSGTRSRSALRSVTYTTSQPSSPGDAVDLAGQPEAGQHAVGVVVGAPADEGQHTGHRASVPNALAHKPTAVPLAAPRDRRRSISISTSRRCGGIAARLFSTTSMPAAAGQTRGGVPCRRLIGQASSSPARVHPDTHHRGSHGRQPIRGR